MTQPADHGSDRLSRRYVFKLVSNIVSLISGFVIEVYAARALGTDAYGNFQFLSSFFQRVVSFLDLGTSTAFFAKLSRRQDDLTLVGFYWVYVLVVGCVTVAGTTVIFALGWHNDLWPSQDGIYVLLAALLAIVAWSGTVAGKINDACGFTESAEMARLVQRCLGVIAIAAMAYADAISYPSYFAFHMLLAASLLVGMSWAAGNHGQFLLGGLPTLREAGRYLQEFYSYAHPLAVSMGVALATNLADLWLLQRNGGSTEQAYFGLALRICGLSLIFMTAMTPLLTRELAMAFDRKDHQQMAALFATHAPALHSVTACMASFVAMNAAFVVRLVGGESFAAAATPMTILSYYPVLQVMGQLTGAICYATANTRLYRNIGVAVSLIGLPASYFLLTWPTAHGEGFGAVGLAAKTVGIAVLSTNGLLFFSTRLLRVDLSRLLLHQVVSLSCFAVMAWGANRVTEEIVSGASPLVALLVSGGLYGAMSILTLAVAPGLWGIDRGRVTALYRAFWRSHARR